MKTMFLPLLVAGALLTGPAFAVSSISPAVPVASKCCCKDCKCVDCKCDKSCCSGGKCAPSCPCK